MDVSDIAIDTWETDQMDLVGVVGSIDVASIAPLQTVLHERLCRLRKDVLLVLSEVSLLDTRTIAELRRLRAAAERAGTRLQVIGAQGVVLEVLQITGSAKQLGAGKTAVPRTAALASHTDGAVPRVSLHLACLPAYRNTFRPTSRPQDADAPSTGPAPGEEIAAGVPPARLEAMIMLHQPVWLPKGTVCRNCGWPHPCPTYRSLVRLVEESY